MSFTTQNMNVFSQRCKVFMASLQNLRQEAAKLDAIYLNEATSGSDPDWGDVNGVTVAEHTDAITLFRDLKLFCESGAVAAVDRQQWITPFTQ